MLTFKASGQAVRKSENLKAGNYGAVQLAIDSAKKNVLGDIVERGQY